MSDIILLSSETLGRPLTKEEIDFNNRVIEAAIENPASSSPPASETEAGISELATQAEIEDSSSTDDTRVVTAKKFWQGIAKMLTLGNFFAAVRGTTLTGLSMASSAYLQASDSFLGAIGKLQAQISAIPNGQMTFQNKTIIPRVTQTTSLATLAINHESYEVYILSEQSGDITIEEPTNNTPYMPFKISITSIGSGNITWGNFGEYKGVAAALPANLVVGKTMYMEFWFNNATSSYDMINYAEQA